jgi:glycosyltransferase involved in cell wall biosynthesis
LLEKWIYVHADKIIFTMEGGKDYIIEKGWEEAIDLKKVFYINNGVDFSQFHFNQEKYQLADKDLQESFFFKIIYAGSIRQANHLEYLIKGAEKLKNEPIKIIIYGDGTEKRKLEEYCKKNALNKVIFKGKIDKKYIPFVLSQGNLNILNTNHTKVLKYGCSQNKLFEYAASGKPILSNCKMGYDLILRYKCGIVEENESPEQYARNILYFYEQKESNKYEDMCKNARKLAEDYEFEKLTDKLIEVIKSCLSAER